MQLLINNVSANDLFFIKRDSEEIKKHINIVNTQCYGGVIMCDIHITLPDGFTISKRSEGVEEFLVVSLSKLGSFELNTRAYRDVTIYN